MGNLFYGLNIGKNTLKAQTSILNMTAHNIANANTPGYSRQKIDIASVSADVGNGQPLFGNVSIGGGVMARGISRSRFYLYDKIYRKENQNLNFNVKMEEFLHQVELLFDEPSDRGLGGIMNDFFNGWLDIGNSPQNVAARQSLYGTANELTDRMSRIYNALIIMREDVDAEITGIPVDINEISSEIADINVTIRIAESQGGTANDLRDKRDLLVDKLSEYANVTAVEQKDSTLTVLVGSKVVVEHDVYSHLKTETIVADRRGMKKTAIVSDDGVEFIPKFGKLGALINFRDEKLIDLMNNLNKLAESIVTIVNFDHRIGYGLDGVNGRNFFNPDLTKAYNMDVSADIKDVTNMAVSGDKSKGDNANALAIFELKDQRKIDNRYSIKEFYNSMIANLGVVSKAAKAGRMNQELLVSQIENVRESIKGVSIDEELVQMIQTQRIFQSAARMIVVIDELIEEIINLK